METKKNPKADLTRKTGFFFSIALLITMSFVLFAFELKQHEEAIGDIVQRNEDVFENMVAPITEITPPPPPVPAPIIVEVPNDAEIEQQIPFIIDQAIPPDAPIAPVVIHVDEPEVTDVPFIAPEEFTSPKRGMSAFYKYLAENIKYPAQARRINTEGKVYIEFVVNRDGSIVDARVIKGIGSGCDEEALRVIQKAPAWSPAKQRGKPVRQKLVVPVTFVLGN